MQKPSIGRIVHHVEPDGSHKPGIIHTVHSDTCVSLSVFGWTGLVHRTSVAFDEGWGQGTWHWPERVEDPSETICVQGDGKGGMDQVIDNADGSTSRRKVL